jgi:hypothetical protein
MQLRSLRLIGILAPACVAFACWSAPRTPVKAEMLVGDYVYHDGSGVPHGADRLTLRADGTYILVHVGGNHPGSKEEGEWDISNGPEYPVVGFANFAHPILVKGNKVRLMVNDDLDQYYEKVR